jgi:hypothetical protein
VAARPGEGVEWPRGPDGWVASVIERDGGGGMVGVAAVWAYWAKWPVRVRVSRFFFSI